MQFIYTLNNENNLQIDITKIYLIFKCSYNDCIYVSVDIIV